MNIYSLPAVISFTINFSIALIVLLDNPKSLLNRWFAAFIFIFAVWNLSEVLLLNSSSREGALLGAQILYRVIFLAPAFFVIITYLFPKNYAPRMTQQPLFYILVFAIPILILSFSFPLFQIELFQLNNTLNFYYYRLKYSLQPAFVMLLLTSLGYMIWGTVILTKKLRRLRTVRQKNQALFLLVGILIIFTLFVSINAGRTILEKRISFYFLSTILTFLISLFFMSAVLQYRIFQVSRIIRSGIIYSLLSTFALAIYFFIIKYLSEGLTDFFQIDSNILTALIIIILIFFIHPLEKRIQHVVDILLTRNTQQYRHHFYQLSHELLTYMQPDVFFHKIDRFLMKNFNTEKIVVFLYNEKNDSFREITQSGGVYEPIPATAKFIKQLFQRRDAVEFYDLNHNGLNKHLLHVLEKDKIRLVLPLIFEKKLLAIIFIAIKRHGRDYSEEDLEILSIFANEVSIAFHRNEIIEKLREEDKRSFHLQKLASLGQLTAGVAHEIRNPLNTISTAAETLQNKKLHESDQQELHQYIIDEVKRLNRILKDFLNLSKYHQPKPELINISNLLNRIILTLEERSPAGVTFKKNNRITTPFFCDVDYLHQLLLNLGINAVDAVVERCKKETSFSCRDGRVEFIFGKKDNQVTIEVADNGIQISEANKDSIFDPFFTTKEQGTGLGLSIVHNIVASLNGHIDFSTTPEETRFVVTLPDRK